MNIAPTPEQKIGAHLAHARRAIAVGNVQTARELLGEVGQLSQTADPPIHQRDGGRDRCCHQGRPRRLKKEPDVNTRRQRFPYPRRPSGPLESAREILEPTKKKLPLTSLLSAETDGDVERAATETWDGYPSRVRGDTR